MIRLIFQIHDWGIDFPEYLSLGASFDGSEWKIPLRYIDDFWGYHGVPYFRKPPYILVGGLEHFLLFHILEVHHPN